MPGVDVCNPAAPTAANGVLDKSITNEYGTNKYLKCNTPNDLIMNYTVQVQVHGGGLEAGRCKHHI